MVPPYSERRHRLNPWEIRPVKDAVHDKLIQILEIRDPDDLLTATSLFKVWYRIHYHVHNKPAYPPHDSFDHIASYLDYGTETGAEPEKPPPAGDEAPKVVSTNPTTEEAET